PADAPQQPCANGQTITAETKGHCCFLAQVWSESRNSCVGIPQCPEGFVVEGELCKKGVPECGYGQQRNADTQGHCCYPGQAWSPAGQACIGLPACPQGTMAQGETCVAATSVPPQLAPPPPASEPGMVPVTFVPRNEFQTGARFVITTPDG